MFNPYKNYRYFRRYRQIIVTVARYGFGELIGRLNLFAKLKLKKSADGAQVQSSRAIRFRNMLEQLGPTFIKLGQILSTRPDLLPADIIEELTHLQDRVTPTPWSQVKKQLDRQLASDFEQIFADFDPEPIASASIAQVYAARLRSGPKVAVKIIRPGTEKTFRDDLLILEHLASLIQAHIEEARRWNVPAFVGHFRASIDRELDLRREGRNADIFRANFADDPNIYVPKIYWEHSSTTMLVMEYIDGRPLAEFFPPHTDRETRSTLARRGAEAVLRQIFDHGFFQADPHPGNTFVMPDNVICFLDFGMFGRLDASALAILARVLHAVVKKDVDRLLKAARDLGVLPDQQNIPDLRVAVLDLIEQYHGVPLKHIDMPRLLREIVQLISRYHVGIRHDFLFLIKALGTIEASGRKLDPNFDMVSHVQPFVRSLLLKRYSPQRLLDDTQRFAEDFTQLAHESPEHMLEILRKIRAGQIKLEFHHKGLEEPFARLNQMSDKIVLGLILAALIIASALLAHVKLGPALFGFPVIGGFGFLVAGVTGLWIIYDILRSRKG